MEYKIINQIVKNLPKNKKLTKNPEIYLRERFLTMYKFKNSANINYDNFKFLSLKKENINIAISFDFKNDILIFYGPTPVSSDGEYKPRAIFMSKIEEEIKDKNNRALLNLVHLFMKEEKNNFITNFMREDITKIFFCYFNIILLYHRFGYPNNINEIIEFKFNKYIVLLGDFKIIETLLSLSSRKEKKKRITKIGIKINPLSISDIRNIGMISNNIWCELFILELLEKLIVNNICPYFPIWLDWEITDIKNLYCYSNYSTFYKYDKSENMLENAKELYKMRDIEDDSDLIITYKQKLEIPINYIEKNLIFTNKVLIVVMEDVGKTLADFLESLKLIIKGKLNWLRHKPKENLLVSNIHLKIILFSFIYNLASINNQGIIHGDLHLNNLTIRTAGTKSMLFKTKNKEFYVITLYECYLIDFGRSCISLEFLKNNFPEELEFLEYSNKKLLNYFSKLMPEFYASNREKIALVQKTQQQSFFKICCALDTYYLINSLRYNNLKYMIPENTEFLLKIEDYLFDFVRKWMLKLFTQNIESFDIPNINETLLETFFTIFTEPFDEIKKVDNLFNMAYSQLDGTINKKNLSEEDKEFVERFKEVHISYDIYNPIKIEPKNINLQKSKKKFKQIQKEELEKLGLDQFL